MPMATPARSTPARPGAARSCRLGFPVGFAARYLLAFALLHHAGAARAHGALDAGWSKVSTPSPGPALAIGRPNAGCVQGAVLLPRRNPAYVIIHPERHRQFGHPDLIQFLHKLAAAAARAQLPPIYIGDLAQARGGPLPTGHRSHQNGLDVDLFYGLPARAASHSGQPAETLPPASVVDLRTHRMLPAWNRGAARLLELAASQPAVDRIFVNPAVKRALCRDKEARGSWLAKLRPWWGHADHFHVRLHCPATSPACIQQAPLAAGDGCDASLAWWFSAEAGKAVAGRPVAPESAPPMPEICGAILDHR